MNHSYVSDPAHWRELKLMCLNTQLTFPPECLRSSQISFISKPANTINFYPQAQSKYLGFKAGEMALRSGAVDSSEDAGLVLVPKL